MTRIKAIVFDLDDTLFDCTGLLSDNSRKRAAKVMVNSGIPWTEENIYNKMIDILGGDKRADVFEEIGKLVGKGHENAVKAGREEYNSDVVDDIYLFDGVKETVRKLRKIYKLVVLTTGVYKRQNKKIQLLGIEDDFDLILINDSEKGSSIEDCFKEVIRKFSLKPKEIVCVGDRIQSEIKVANRLGMITVRMLHGRFKDLKPKSDLEIPDFEIEKIQDMERVLGELEKRRDFNVVAIGGGTGLPKLLEGLKKYTENITAIVTVMDSGRSSGEIRKNLNILPPGDIRNCLVSLSNSEDSLRELFQYRFEGGKFEGLSFGSLFIAALVKVKGSFEEGVREASRILKLKGKVLPPTLADTHLCAELEDGTVIEEEVNIIKAGKSPIKRVFLMDGNVKALNETIDSITEADIIVLGPGCLFTSIIPNLLVKRIPEAIRNSNAKKLYICNIATQPGQTDDYRASDHIKKILEYLGEGVLDFVLLNNRKPGRDIMENYEKAGSTLVENDEKVKEMGIEIIEKDVIEEKKRDKLWIKQDWLRHDPDKLCDVIMDIANGNDLTGKLAKHKNAS